MKPSALFLLGVLVAPLQLSAQSAEAYAPSDQLPVSPTSELVMVFLSTSSCAGNQHPELGTSIHAMKRTLAERARERSGSFRAVGVAAEWSVEDGLAYLLTGKSTAGVHQFGAWDEVRAGSNWLSSAAVDYVWRDSDGEAYVPQVILLEREISMSGRRIAVSEDTPVLRLVGTDQITGWVVAGMPLP